MLNKSVFRITFLILWFIQSCGQEKQTFEYYQFPYAKGKERVITKMILEDRVYFINYYYNKKEIPSSYISPLSGMDNYYLCYLYWEDDKAFLLTDMGEWQVIGNPKNFHFVDLEDNTEYNKITADKSGKYQHSSGDIIIY